MKKEYDFTNAEQGKFYIPLVFKSIKLLTDPRFTLHQFFNT